MDGTSPCPRKRNLASSFRRITQRGRKLPASSPTASFSLSIITRLQRRDAIVKPQIERRCARHLVMDVGEMIQKILKPRGKIVVSQHQYHCAALQLLSDF